MLMDFWRTGPKSCLSYAHGMIMQSLHGNGVKYLKLTLVKIMVRSYSVGKECHICFCFCSFCFFVFCFLFFLRGGWVTYRVKPWLDWPFFNFHYITLQTVTIHLIYSASLRPHIRGKQELSPLQGVSIGFSSSQ